MTIEITREEHLAWCKKRALEYCELGDANSALVSMYSDLDNHPQTAGHAGIRLGVMMQVAGQLSTPEEARKFINGFN